MELRFTYRLTTPLFMGGSDPTVPELRPPSFKGLLRFWYRAVDPEFALSPGRDHPDRETSVFGGQGGAAGQSPVLLSIEPLDLPTHLTWKALRPERFNDGNGRNTRNGLVYLGFPFQMLGREALAPGHGFVLRCRFRPVAPGREELLLDRLRAWTAAAWLLGHFGGAGSRSRRGFGGLSLVATEARGIKDWDAADLPLAAAAADVAAARAALDTGLATLRAWFGTWPAKDKDDYPHPHLGAKFRFKLWDEGVAPADYADGLDRLGRRMQEFRVRRAPDYAQVKAQVEGRAPLEQVPQRASFGLPLTFRFGSVPGGRPATIAPYDRNRRSTFERHGSLLFLRLLAVGDRLYPLVSRLDGAVPGSDPPAAIRNAPRPLRPAAANAMDAFFDSLPGQG